MISIAMATYNGERYIREQINSIFLQTIQDFELVICDDCSTDGTWSILTEYANKDNRIRIYKNSKNIGYRRNFEGLVPLCNYEYIAFCDQDDIWLSNHLEVLYRGIKDRDISTADAEIIDENGISKGYLLSDFTQLRRWPKNPLDQAYTYFYYRNPFPGCNTMFRKSFLQRIYPIRMDEIQLHDTFADSVACVCGKGIGYVDVVSMKYRFHQNSVTAGGKTNNKQKPFKCILRKLISGSNSVNFRYVKDRRFYVDEITSRDFHLDENQKRFLSEVYEYQRRRETLYGRLRNFIFDIRHYRKIYLK